MKKNTETIITQKELNKIKKFLLNKKNITDKLDINTRNKYMIVIMDIVTKFDTIIDRQLDNQTNN
jgi:hypothetical protein